MKNRKMSVVKITLLVLLGAFTHSSFAQPSGSLPADLDAKSLARLPYIQRKNLDASGQAIYDLLPGRSEEGFVAGPLAFAAYNPTVAKALLNLHDAAVGDGILAADVRELAILVACRETNYHLEWNAHEPSAVKQGVAASVIDVVRNQQPVTGLDAKSATIIQFGRQLFTDRKVDSATFKQAVELLTERGVMDMVAVMNTYAVSGFFAIAVDEHMPAGQAVLK
jgi:4-carboxymuconolactone decarboxylase